jgi:drug/metabolite transporter (DMT)-like permease
MLPAGPDASTQALRLMPILFVLIWSTGWIVAGFAMPHAEPITFLVVRFAIAGALILGFALIVRAPWPDSPASFLHALLSGLLLHAAYLGPVYWAIEAGLPTGISAILAAIQPILTAFLAPLILAERVSARQWLGILLGAGGLLLVLLPKLVGIPADQVKASLLVLLVNALGMVSVTLGSLHQKRYVRGDLRTVSVIQYAGAVLVLGPIMLASETMRIDWTPAFVGALAWSVVVISLGAITLYQLMIRRGAVARAASLIYLVPPVAVLQSWLFFGETLSLVQIAGMVVTVAGVALATRAR